MKVFKTILWTLLIVVTLVFFAGFLLPRKISVSRSIYVHAGADLVFEQINTLKNWENWSPWNKTDKSVIIRYSGPDKGENAAYSWESENEKTGNGRIEILQSYPYDSIVLEMDFIEKGNAICRFIFSQADSGTVITWKLYSELGRNPLTRYYGLLMKKYVADDFESGLENLEQHIHLQSQVYKNFEITDTVIPACITLTLRDTCNVSEFEASMSALIKKIFNIMSARKIQPSGYPFVVYHSVTPGIIDFETGIRVMARFPLPDSDFIFTEYPDRDALLIRFNGEYNETKYAYEDLQRYVTLKKLKPASPIIEEYITDHPLTEKDTAKWHINIYLPIK